jgi:hypothetical protein
LAFALGLPVVPGDETLTAPPLELRRHRQHRAGFAAIYIARFSATSGVPQCRHRVHL